jgi:hypothetical protein
MPKRKTSNQFWIEPKGKERKKLLAADKIDDEEMAGLISKRLPDWKKIKKEFAHIFTTRSITHAQIENYFAVTKYYEKISSK